MKRKKTLQKLAGLMPIFSLGTGSRYNHLYRDTEAGRLAWPRRKAVSRYKTLYRGWGGGCVAIGAAWVWCVTIQRLYHDRSGD